MPATSGSFVKGNQSGRSPIAFVLDYEPTSEPYSTGSILFDYEVTSENASNQPISIKKAGAWIGSNTASIGQTLGIGLKGTYGNIGVSLAHATTLTGDGSFGKSMQVGVSRNITEGYLTASCLSLDLPGMWRFRWAVQSGSRSISISTKQNSTGSYRPTMTVKANPSIGLSASMSGSAANSAGWTTIGPLSFNATDVGVVWVELRNNNTYMPSMYDETNSSYHALFDHIVTT